MTDRIIKESQSHKLLTLGKSKCSNLFSIPHFNRSCLFVIFCFSQLAICGSVQSQIYPADLEQLFYDVDLDWADHQVVPLTKQPFGSGVPGKIGGTYLHAEIWTFGASQENGFPCRGYLYKQDGKLNCMPRTRDERVANVFETPENLDVLLREISNLNAADSGPDFEPRRLIQLGRQMKKVSPPEAFWSLVEFNRIVPAEWNGHGGVALIIRYLYPNGWRNFYGYDRTGFDGETNKKTVERYPNFPIVILKGIPFCASYGYVLGGQGARRMTIPKDVKSQRITTYTIDSQLTVGDVLDEIEAAYQLPHKELVLSQLNSLLKTELNTRSDTKPVLKFENFEGVRSWKWNNDSCMFEDNEGGVKQEAKTPATKPNQTTSPTSCKQDEYLRKVLSHRARR